MEAASPSSALASSRRRTLGRLRAVIALAIALPLVALAATAAYLYRQTYEEARQDLDAASRIAQEHALKMLETNEMLLARMLDLLGSDTDEKVLARGAEIHARLKDMARELPQVQGLYTHGADARSLGTSLTFPAPRDIDYSDRSWYIAHRAGLGEPVFITEQLRSRISGEPFFDMSRRRNRADGSFAGVVNVSLRPEYLTAFWEQLAISAHGLRIAVLRADGKFIARWPGTVPPGAALPDDGLLQRMATAGDYGQVEMKSPFDGGVRLVAFRKLGGYPLHVVAVYARPDVLGDWLRRVAWIAMFVVPFGVALTSMAWLALKRTREELDAVQRLEEETARRQRSELALAKAQKLETVGHLAGGVAHDFNNLLMIVNNNLHLLRRRHPELGDREISAIERAVGGGTRLTRQLLSLSGRQALAPERVLLQERLPLMLSLVRSALPATVVLDWQVAPDTAPIFVDAAELELALINLAINARDAMHGGGGRLSVTASDVRGHVVIEVADDGPGIDPAILDRVREPFFTTKGVGKGSGLGLTQVEGFCVRSGGRLEIEPRKGGGTRVLLCLPPAAGDGLPAGEALASLRAGELRCKLLLVEDNEALAHATVPVLESLGCEVSHVGNAQAALDVVEQRDFDVVLSDIEMPGRMDGIELAATLTQRRRPLPIVLMSGYAKRIEDARTQGLEVLPKPCSPEQLRSALAAALARQKKAAAA